MSDTSTPARPAGRLLPSGRQYRSTSQSPTRQRLIPDDLLSHLSPMNAVEAFRSPTGPLKASMQIATATEQAFAIRAAVASEKIYTWLSELLEWPWPTRGPAGFEIPVVKRRKVSWGDNTVLGSESISDNVQHQEQMSYMGSLPATDVSRFEQRIEEIQRDMDELDLEEIKSHVLHNHILPLSRPGTPLSDRSVTSSLSSFVRMDDLTAIITATVVQALPNLSKLIRLMNTWSVRLAVLRRVPVMLAALADAEVAIQSGWNAVELSTKHDVNELPGNGVSTLSRKDFEIMKLVLEKKVAKTARELDYMLDSLEGREDTLPDEWCDRMDSLERGYSEWVATCEQKIREAEWAKAIREMPPARSLNSAKTSGAADIIALDVLQGDTLPKDAQETSRTESSSVPSAHTDATPRVDLNVDPSREQTGRQNEKDIESHAQGGHVSLPEPATTSNERKQDNHHDDASQTSLLNGGALVPELPSFIVEDVGTTTSADIRPSAIADQVKAPSDPSNITDSSEMSSVQPLVSVERTERPDSQWDDGSESDLEVPSPRLFTSDEREPSLPPSLKVERPGSSASTSTVIHQNGGAVHVASSLPKFVDTPEFARMQIVDPMGSDELGLPSSPPEEISDPRMSSEISKDMPTLTEGPDDEDPPKTPLESSFFDESDYAQEYGSPSRMSEASSADDQLQQQISEILESIPAKIHLSSQPNPVNLNPPDLQLPYTKPKPVDRPARSQSSLSSRAGTPSFLLSPAYARNPRPRQQRGNQEIKLYHLSRSTGEAPIKLFIRCVGDNAERVMVRVGGGWADLGEYLKEYASHHGRRSTRGEGKVEIKDLPRVSTGRADSSPASRPGSALDSPMTPLNVRKTRKSVGEEAAGARFPKTPLAASALSSDTPSSEASTRSRSSSRLSWTEEDSTLGMAGPRSKNVEMSEESKAWVESVKEKVRIASGERKASNPKLEERLGELGRVGATKRLFRKGGAG
ncbi:Gas2 domain protein [Pleurostoma richardsiae]|uniref:Gas2 domain protein n=1 Tax=Pleurostoma richardsiae TaxID=41990 RepID=A0AA38VUB9_9PEZI|nr:Gas2 domain protein [Pleurostoma richardsiae]